MTLIIPVTRMPAQLIAGVWTLKSPQVPRNKRGCLKLLHWLEGNSPRSSLKGTNLELVWGRVWVLFGRCMRRMAGSECQGSHCVLYMAFQAGAFG